MELPFGGTFASDTFETGTRAAAHGGTTTIVDFAVQRAGERVQDGLAAWHDEGARATARSTTASTRSSAGSTTSRSRPWTSSSTRASPASSCFMAYPGVFYSDDGQILRAMQTAASNGSMIMMHAENGTAIDVLVAQALARGETAPRYHGAHPALGDRGGGDPPRDHAGAAHRRPALRRAHVGQAGGRARSRRRAARAGTCSARPARSTSTSRSRSTSRAPGFEGAKWVCSTPLRSRDGGPPGRAVALPAHRRPLGGQHRPLPVLLQGAEGARHRRLLQDPQRDRRRRAPDGPALPGRRRRPDLAHAVGRDLLHDARTDVRAAPAQGRDPARSRRRHRDLRPAGAHPHLGRDAPHEHGPLGLGGLRDRGRGRHGALARPRGRAEGRLPRHHRSRAVPAPRPVVVPRPRRSHGLRRRAAVQPARVAGRRPGQEGRARRLQPRLDLRLAPALAGAVRDLQPDPGADPPRHRRADGDQPGDARLDRHRLDVRHAQRHVRQPHGVRHRPRRLGGPRDQRQARRRSPSSGRASR